MAATCGAAAPEGRGRALGSEAERAPFAPALAAPPLPPPLDVTGGFCEYRRGHFHGGFDFGTGRRVGRPVVAPGSGTIERVRASGVGYGRSLYLRADDGRLLVFAHLDAFVEPLASFVRAIQDSTGVYEQDLWPEAGRFRFGAGEPIAWTGESGAGGPHLHFEIRRGDMAHHPQRGGLAVPDTAPPTLTALTLEPLDAGSRVAGSAGPRTFALERPETVEVTGRVRAIVGARDGIWSGVDRMVPWEVGLEWDGKRTLVRFDSVSWATDMEEGDLVYDAGRVLDSKGIVLWARAGFRPRVLRSDAPLAAEAGTIGVRQGDLPRPLTLWARDLGGGAVERRVVLRPPRGDAHAPAAGAAPAGEPWGDPPLAFASLPGGALRLTLPAARGRDGVAFRLGTRARPASRSDDGWAAVFAPPSPSGSGVGLGWSERDAAGAERARTGRAQTWRASPTRALELHEAGGERRVRLPAGALFEEATLLAFPVALEAPRGLVPLGDAWRVEPARLPLARAATVEAPVAPGVPLRGVGLYRRGEGGWQWLGGAEDTNARVIRAGSRQLGAFALLRDAEPPRVPRWEVVRDVASLPYSRWALEAVVVEDGSGLFARGSWLEVDGRRVPTEWDPEAGRLRWRPASAPAPGEHRVRIVAADRAGNIAEVEGTFRVEG